MREQHEPSYRFSKARKHEQLFHCTFLIGRLLCRVNPVVEVEIDDLRKRAWFLNIRKLRLIAMMRRRREGRPKS